MFDFPRKTILPVDAIIMRLIDTPHAYEVEHREAIDANWQQEKARQPRLFDGEMILLSQAAYRNRRIEGECHPIRFATFLHWRRNHSASAGFHVFANAVPVTSDGALVAIRMGQHTANAGRVYFAAGSFERQDFSDGLANVEFNMHREVAEETGIDLASVPREKEYHAFCSAAGLTLIRRYRLAQDAEAVAAGVRAFIGADPDPEAEDVVVIRSEEDVPDTSPAHMKPLVRWHFSGNAHFDPKE